MWIVAPNPVSQHDDEHSVESVTVGVLAVGKAVNERDEQRWAKATGEACGLAGGRARWPAMLDGHVHSRVPGPFRLADRSRNSGRVGSVQTLFKIRCDGVMV